MADLLVVEDDAAIGRALRTSLIANGHEVTWVQSGVDAVSAVEAGSFGLVLLDLGLPDMDGLDVCRQLRASQPACTIVILTARDEEIDVVVGLESGADDYLTKPFRLAELIARVRAHLRRNASPGYEAPVLRVGALEVDAAARRVRVGNVEVNLRAKEFDLLARLAAEPGTAVSRTSLMCDVWDENWFGSTKTLDVHVSALRRKLADASSTAQVRAPEIVTLRARGYRLEGDRSQLT